MSISPAVGRPEREAGARAASAGLPASARAAPHAASQRARLSARLNWLRAGVLGANDGIVSVAAVIVGVAGATSHLPAILTAGIAALVGGALSMALGEYVSVSSQSDSQRALIARREQAHRVDPVRQRELLVEFYRAKGLTAPTARQVAAELSGDGSLEAHLDAELGMDARDVVSALHAAVASAAAFLVGAALPIAAVLAAPDGWRVAATFAAVLVALSLTGAVGAWLGQAPAGRATMRVVAGGTLALGATFAIGSLLGATGVV